MHAPLSTSVDVPVWGVLVSQNTPTSENGLLPFAVERYASRTRDVVAEATTTTTRRTPAAGPVWTSEGDAWLWAQLPPALRLQHYPALEQSATPLRHTAATTTGVEAQTKAALMDEEAEYAQLRLLLPLCRAGQGSVTVGRLLSNDFSLPTNPCISSVHCSLSYQPSSTRRAEKNSSPHPHRSAASPTTSAGAGAGAGAGSGGGGGVVVADGPEMREARAAVDRAVAQHHGLPSMSLDGTHAHREAESDAEKGETEGGEENRKNGKDGQRAAVEEEEAAAHILLSDYSTNGCSVNGHFVGKGKSARLYNGDLVELINAGPRHTTDYNLAFRFFTVSGFLRWAAAAAAASATHATGDTDTTSETQTQQGKGKKGGVEKEEAKEVQGTQRQQQQQLKKQQQREQQTAARRRALLCKAQWNVEAQVRRMYHHRVDEFYDLDRAKPLGQGTFGVVYRASLRADAAAGVTNAKGAASASAATTTAPPPSTLREVAAAVFAQAGVGTQAAAVAAAYSHNTDVASALEHQLFSTAAACVWTAAPEAEKRLAEAYVREKEVRAPTTVLRAVSSSSSSSSSSTAVAGAPCLFAVKIVRKQRMLLDVLHQQQQQQQQQKPQDTGLSMRGEMKDGHANTPAPAATVTSSLSKAEAALLQQLVQLETQPDDLAEQRREEWTAGALASLQLADSVLSPSQQHQQASTSLERLLSTFSNYTQEREKEDEEEHSNTTEGPASHGAVAAAAAAVGSVAAVAHKQQQRELQRLQLLRCLPDALRKAYEKELQHRRRQQCEINILLAVRHPNVTTLYEVFDQPDQLALVMEQATGGEVWDLLQPYQRRRRRGPAAKHVRCDGDNSEGPRVSSASDPANSTTAAKKEEEEEEEMAAYDDVDLTSTGGPLPEYVVKLIIVQVLEAVLYLHTMGIIHRDLKLENLMLHRPCDRYALNALQLQVLLQQLRNYEKQDGQAAQPGPPTSSSSPPSPSASASADSPLSGTLMAETEFSNPLSPLHTVHIPRSMWPVVKVTDFGLSRVLDQLQTRPHTNSSGDGDGVLQTLHGLTAADGGLRGDADKNKAVPERVKLIYSRNDATTSCGTPIYAAPEVTMSGLRPNKVGYGAAVDMYSVGVIAYALLTGRAPFPSRRSAHRPNGPPVIDYDAPLTFYRHRRRPASKSDPSPSTHPQLRRPPAPTVDDPAVRLPELSTAEYVRVPITAELRAATDNSSSRNKSSSSGGASASLSASAHAQRWHARTAALANRIRLAEGSSGSASAAPFFATTVRRLCESLSAYASGCAARGEEVDIDRLVSVSAAHEQAAAAEAVNGRVRGADGVVTGVVLPPISALGAAFLRGLLEKYPSQRLTAYEALRHPWLRECVDLPPTA